MAIGDGWERRLWVTLPTGERVDVAFGDYNAATMTPDSPYYMKNREKF